MKKRGRSLMRDVHKINLLVDTVRAADLLAVDLRKEIATLKREAVHARGQATWAAHVLGIAGECLQSRGGTETARLCRITANNLMPLEQGCGMSIGATNEEARR